MGAKSLHLKIDYARFGIVAVGSGDGVIKDDSGEVVVVGIRRVSTGEINRDKRRARLLAYQ